MARAEDALDAAIREADSALTRVRRQRSSQVRTRDERDNLKAVAYAWFKSHRGAVGYQSAADGVDEHYKRILEATDKFAARSTYVNALRDAKRALVSLRSQIVVAQASRAETNDSPPDFSPLASDAQMKEILERRWRECQRCMAAHAHLAATVMMGGLLEALFVARANKMGDKRPLFAAKATPINAKTNKALPLHEWTLRPYIDVASEVGWITKSGKEVAAVLRDYRNYVHPEKERSHGVTLTEHDSSMFWNLTKEIARQLLRSATR